MTGTQDPTGQTARNGTGRTNLHAAAIFRSMGTTVSFRAADESTYILIPRLEALFADADARFSLYRPESELSRIAAGELG